MSKDKKEKLGFSEETEFVNKKTLKLNQQRSEVKSERHSKAEFEKQADAVINSLDDRKERAVEIVKKFWDIVRDTTLVDNKGLIRKNIEKEVVSELLNLASEMNNDPNEPESSGSVALITLLLKTVLHERDQINQLSFKLQQLEAKLTKSVESKA